MKKSKLVLILFIVVAAFYMKSVTYDFVLWDDDTYLIETKVFDPLTIGSFVRFWRNPQIFPLVYTIWGVEHAVLKAAGHKSGFSPFLFHLNNVLCHSVCAVLVFLIILQYFKKKRLAFLAALLFAFHPIQVESVAWVSGFKDSLSGMLYLLCMYSFMVFHEKRNSGNKASYYYVMSFLAFIGALSSKATTASITVVLFLLNILYYRKKLKESIKIILPWLVMTAAMVIVIIIEYNTFRVDLEVELLRIVSRLVIVGDSMLHYIVKILFPFSLGIDYGRTPSFVMQESGIKLLALLPLAGFLPFFLIKKSYVRDLIIPYVLFILPLVPFLGIVPFRFQNISTVADRYAYLSVFGAVFIFAYFVKDIDYRKKRILSVFLIILVSYAVKTWTQMDTWKGTYSLMTNAVKVNPNSAVAYNNLGVYWHRKEANNTALHYFLLSEQAQPEYVDALYNIATIYYTKKDYRKAIEYYRKTTSSQKEYYMAYFYEGVAYFQLEEYESAAENLKQTLALVPEYYVAYYYLGRIAELAGRYEEATEYYSYSSRQTPHKNIVESYPGFYATEMMNESKE